MTKGKIRGTMLVEVLILAPVISLLTTVSILAVKRVSQDAEVATVAGHLTKFAAGLDLYALDHGHYPPERHQSGSLGSWDESRQYIDPDAWLHSAPLGGWFDWQGADAWPQAGICVRQFTASRDTLEQLDQRIDDGNLDSGRLRLTSGGTRLTYVLKE